MPPCSSHALGGRQQSSYQAKSRSLSEDIIVSETPADDRNKDTGVILPPNTALHMLAPEDKSYPFQHWLHKKKFPVANS